MKNINRLPKQQGDVLLIPVDATALEGKQTPISKRRCVLAEGEATGHAHVVEDDEAALVQIGEKMLLSLAKPATVVHEEHGPIKLEAGIWEIGRVREFDYLKDMVTPVRD
jgi:hypothetical protein